MKRIRRSVIALTLLAGLGLGAYGFIARTQEQAKQFAVISRQTALDSKKSSLTVATAPPPVNAPALQPASSSGSLAVPEIFASGASVSDGTYTGDVANAYYGMVQVALVVSGSRVTNVKILQYPNDNGTSRYINSIALPYLIQETVKAQSSNIYLVSGATFTSQAFAQSLSTALSKAGIG